MKVSPEYFIQLSHRVKHFAQRKKKGKSLSKVQVKRTGG